MNIVTKSDVNKFLKLVKLGLNHGTAKNLKNYSRATMVDGTNIPKSYYVSLELSFNIDPEHLGQMLFDDSIETEIDDLLK